MNPHKYTIEDLAKNQCALINDGTIEELREVIHKAFPQGYSGDDEWWGFVYKDYKVFTSNSSDNTYWNASPEPYNNKPVQSVKVFYDQINNHEKNIS